MFCVGGGGGGGFKNERKAIFYRMLPHFRKNNTVLEGSQATPFCMNKTSVNWWTEADRGKPYYSEKNLSQCKFVPQKSHMDSAGIETKPPLWGGPLKNRQRHSTAFRD